MRDLDPLLNSLVNIDRKSLIAILSSEAEAARQLVTAARQRTASQRAKRHEAERLAARAVGCCPSSSTATSRRTCPSATSNSANPLNKSCVRGAKLIATRIRQGHALNRRERRLRCTAAKIQGRKATQIKRSDNVAQ